MRLFNYNGYYLVLAENRKEADEKLRPHLVIEHSWYLHPGAEDCSRQGHLTVKEFPIVDGVVILPEGVFCAWPQQL